MSSLKFQIQNKYDSSRQSSSKYQEKEELRNRLEQQFENLFEGSIQVNIMGSSRVDSLVMNNSDLDLCVRLKKRRYDLTQEEILEKFRAKIYHANSVLHYPLIVGKYKPILRFQMDEFNCKLKVDLQIYSEQVKESNKLIEGYAGADRRFPILAVILKLWAKANGIHGGNQGKLSSYAIILLLIQYLQHGCEPPIFLPRDASSWCPIKKTSETLGELLIGFFEYYSDFDFDTRAVSVRVGHPIKNKHSEDLISIEEPYKRTNVSKTIRHKSIFEKIKQTIASSYSLLEANENLNDIF